MSVLCRLALLLLLAPGLAWAAGGTSCHIHPPGSTPDNPVNIVGPYDSIQACEAARQRLFGPGARCHCTADFTPRWRQPEPGGRTFDARPLM